MIWLSFFFLLSRVNAESSISSICSGDLALDLPRRHLYIQLTSDGVNATESLGDVSHTVEAAEGCRYFSRVVDRGDGSYVFELRVYTTCAEMKISIKYGDQHLCSSPLLVQKSRPLQPESCDCPIPIEDWLQEADCQAEPQIDRDLQHWNSINFTEFLERGRQSWGQENHRRSFSVCHYQILENRIYRDCFGEYDGFKEFLDIMLISLAKKMKLPNTEFLFNLGDYPLSYNKNDKIPIPLISWCGTTSTFDIVLPTYMMTNQILTYSDDILTTNIPYTKWEDKHDRAVFRGRDSNTLRLKLAKLSEKEPDLDIGITAYFFHKEADHTPKVARMPFADFFMSRYIISVDGTVAAYRLPSLFTGNSIVLKSDSTFYEHFYSKLEPYTHYIPFNEYNISKVIKEARTMDHRKIILSAKQFMIDNLQPKQVYCYYAKFLQTYSQKLETPTGKVAAGMEEAVDKKDESCNCRVERAKNEL